MRRNTGEGKMSLIMPSMQGGDLLKRAGLYKRAPQRRWEAGMKTGILIFLWCGTAENVTIGNSPVIRLFEIL